MSGRDGHAGDLLAALVDGRLTERERRHLLDHLAACPACLTEYDAQLSLKGLLGALPDPGAPDTLRARLAGLPTAPVPVDAAAGVREPRPPRSGPARATRAGAALLTASAVTLGAAYLVGGAATGEAVVPPVDRYVREHAAVSVGVPLSQPALYQLVAQPVPYVLPTVLSQPVSVPLAATASPAVVGR